MKREVDNKSKGMLFKAEMIRALLNTKPDVWPAEPIDPAKPFKWQTRRGIKPQPVESDGGFIYKGRFDSTRLFLSLRCPYPVGKIVYAQETWKPHCDEQLWTCIKYRADGALIKPTDWTSEQGFRIEAQEETTDWKPSMFMPKFAARIWCVVKRVRVERVNEISESDAIAEGVDGSSIAKLNEEEKSLVDWPVYRHERPATSRYSLLFDSINGNGSFNRGDFVWAYDIARISKPT